MASGLPVVATSTTVRGLTPYVAEVVETADTAEELAARITRLLGDPDVARLKGLESRSRVAADYSWARSMDRLLELVENPAISVAAGVLAAKQ
jgi:glycosyltransferase involved in cell wall biosynthesis